MLVLKTKNEVRNHLDTLRKDTTISIGFVPTMGALHQGHLSLLEKSLQENTHTIVSIFVNPTQFNRSEDLETYPRTLTADLNLLKTKSSQISVFAPDAKELYSENITSKQYNFEGLDKVMEGAFRPGHFEGVATVLEIFFKTISPNKAYFGEKDYQQLLIIKKFNASLGLGIEIIGCPILRQESGLAMSSRNERLTAAQRAEAAIIFQTLSQIKDQFQGNDARKDVKELSEWVHQEFKKHPDFELEYFQIVNTETLQTVSQLQNNENYRAFIAAYVGGVRLIDNIALH